MRKYLLLFVEAEKNVWRDTKLCNNIGYLKEEGDRWMHLIFLHMSLLFYLLQPKLLRYNLP